MRVIVPFWRVIVCSTHLRYQLGGGGAIEGRLQVVGAVLSVGARAKLPFRLPAGKADVPATPLRHHCTLPQVVMRRLIVG